MFRYYPEFVIHEKAPLMWSKWEKICNLMQYSQKPINLSFLRFYPSKCDF